MHVNYLLFWAQLTNISVWILRIFLMLVVDLFKITELHLSDYCLKQWFPTRKRCSPLCEEMSDAEEMWAGMLTGDKNKAGKSCQKELIKIDSQEMSKWLEVYLTLQIVS